MHHSMKTSSKLIESTEKFWETVYNQNIGKMIGISYRYTANRQLSEDLAHDAFLKAINRSDSFEGKGSFEGWLRRIVVNHTLQYLRDQKRRKYKEDWLLREHDVLQPEDHSLNLHESLEFSEKELLEIVNALPEHHRLVFNLYVIDDFTHVQIAEQLGISSGTSKSHLSRARKKIKQLLSERAGKTRVRKTRILFFLYPFRSIDQLYRKQFNNFGLSPNKFALPDLSAARAVSAVGSSITTVSNSIIAISIGLILTAGLITFYWYQRTGIINTTAGTHLAQSVIHNEKEHARPVLKDNEERSEREKTVDRKNNSSRADSIAATISRTSVIPKTIKNKRMKKLDSLGAMLLVSSSIVFDSSAQADHKTDPPIYVQTRISVGEASSESKVVEVTGAKVKESKGEEGTFYASSLLWSDENNELYLKGKVVVAFGDNNFIGDGTFSFLGPVYLVIVDDQPAKVGSNIKLSSQQYHLTRLSTKQATEKYGEKGLHGAVEISVVK